MYQDRQDSTTAFVYISCGSLAWNMRDRSHDPSHYERTLYYGAKSSSQCDKHVHLTSSATAFEGSDLLNDAHLFYLRLYGVGHMVKDDSDSEKETRRRHMGYSFRVATRVLLYMHLPSDRITHTTAFVTPVVVHWLERK